MESRRRARIQLGRTKARRVLIQRGALSVAEYDEGKYAYFRLYASGGGTDMEALQQVLGGYLTTMSNHVNWALASQDGIELAGELMMEYAEDAHNDALFWLGRTLKDSGRDPTRFAQIVKAYHELPIHLADVSVFRPWNGKRWLV